MLQNDNRGKHIAPIEDSFGAGFRPVSTSSVTHDGFPNGFDLLNSDGLRRVKKKKSKLPKILITVFAVLFALIVCAGIALALWVNSLNKSMGFEDEAQKQELMRVLAPSNDGQNAQESSAFYMLILGQARC